MGSSKKSIFNKIFTRKNGFIIPNIISTAAIELIFLNIYSPSRGIVTEICNMISPGSNVSVLANEKYAFWGVTFAFILFGGSSCLLLLTQIFSIDTSIYEAITAYSKNLNGMFSAIIVTVVPTIVVFCLLSETFVKSLTAGVVKG